MEEIAISKFKATCLSVPETVRKTGKTVVTRFGEQWPRLFHLPRNGNNGWVLWQGQVKSMGTLCLPLAKKMTGTLCANEASAGYTHLGVERS